MTSPFDYFAARWPEVWSTVEHDGSWWTPLPRPPRLRKRRDRACFVNCATHPLVLSGEYLYCEGFARSGDVDIWVHHAWLGDARGNAVDVTWQEPGVEYFGRSFGLALVNASLREEANRDGFGGMARR